VFASGSGLCQGESDIPCEFLINTMNAGAGALPGRAFASGSGLHQGECGIPCEFLVNTITADGGSLAVSIDGPSKVQLDGREVAEGKNETFLSRFSDRSFIYD
jgi:hypothetical protein